MRLVIEESGDGRQKALIVDPSSTSLAKSIRSHLRNYDCDIYFSSRVPKNIDQFNYIFLINQESQRLLEEELENQKIVFIFINRKKTAEQLAGRLIKKQADNIRVVSISPDIYKDDLDKIIWFALSKHKEVFLKIENASLRTIKKRLINFSPQKIFTKKAIISFLIVFFALYLFSFIPFVMASSYFFYKSSNYLLQSDTNHAKKYLSYGETSLNLANGLYGLSRPIYLITSSSLMADNMIELNEKAKVSLQKGVLIYENGSQVLKEILRKDKNEQETALLSLRISRLRKDVDQLEENLVIFEKKLPEYPKKIKNLKQRIKTDVELIGGYKKLLGFFEEIFAKNSQKRYLLLFANNMELRPGGGFIGSFGVLETKNLTLNELNVYDVYDADGQLKEHIEPPKAIRDYLDQPNWFLRDSAFSPDFYKNYLQAKIFLDKELGKQNFSGAILLTTTAVQNIIEAFDKLYIPDFEEEVTKDNFYLKSQIYADKKFFPGSIQKKSFLGAVTRQILINLERVSLIELSRSLKKSLDEKQLVLAFENSDIQQIVDSFYWSGKVINPECEKAKNCISDYIFPYDANLGVNKANFFVSKLITQRVRIENDGKIANTFTIKTKNESLGDVFPGGKYKNYFQVLLPKDSSIKNITKNDVLIEDYDLGEEQFKTVGFLFEISPQKSSEIRIDYELLNKIEKGRSVYQFVFQKQIGSENSDFILEIILPENIKLLNQNFSPLVKDNRIFYNTNLNADKIFLLELERK